MTGIDCHVQSYQVHPSGELRLSAFQRFFETASRADCDRIGATYSALLQKDVVFIITKIHYDIKAMPRCDSDFVMRSWSERVGGVIFTRCFDATASGKTVVSGYSEWALMNIKTRRPERTSTIDMPFENMLLMPDYSFVRRIDAEGATFAGDRIVYESDLDQNNHLNNSRYADIAIDFLPIEMQKSPRNATFIYSSECRLGDKLEINTRCDANSANVLINNTTSSKLAFSAQFVY